MKHEPGMAYNMKTLNKVFAFLSVIFLMVTFWVLLDDYLRPWKAIQVKGMEVKAKVLAKKIEEEQKKLNLKTKAQFEAKLKEAQENLKKVDNSEKEIRTTLANIDGVIKKLTIENGQLSSKYSETLFKYEHAVGLKDKKKMKKYKKKLTKLNAVWAAKKEEAKAQRDKQNEWKQKLTNHYKERDKYQTSITKMTAGLDRIKFAKEKVLPSRLLPCPTSSWPFNCTEEEMKQNSVVVSLVRNSPLIDFLDPTVKANQVVVDVVNDDLYFRSVQRVDRCTTCHMYADKPGYESEDIPKLYRTHPNLELMVGMDSPHPYKKFGCTACHGGMGHRFSDFNGPAHTPENMAQQKEWEEKYHYHEPHKVPSPMYKLSQTESQCLKCHQNVVYVPKAEKLNKGRQLMHDYGCYGCHKIEGWEDFRKTGPSLYKVKGKLTKEFAKNWIWAPKSFSKHAKMPSYFNQKNNSKGKFLDYTVAEVNSMVEYLWDKSEGYKPFAKYVGGDEQKGKELVSEVGCLGCHQIAGLDEPYDQPKSKFGPYLDAIGSKADPDWLVSWLIKPSHYQPDTKMPSLRITNKEANDIAAYLISMRNKDFEERVLAKEDMKDVDYLLTDYYSSMQTEKAAKAQLAKMTEREKIMDLGHRSIAKYGCYTCHNISGFEKGGYIGPELTKEGSKPVTQFGFGHEKIPHTREDWIWHHLQEPARWDAGAPKKFSELNKMPNFYLNKDELDHLTIAILGQVSEKIPAVGQRKLDEHEAKEAKNFKTVHQFNCIGCHNINGNWGEIIKAYDGEWHEGPPRLVQEGHRVKAEWFHYFLNNVHEIRPWLKVRMPSYKFNNEQINSIVSYFRNQAKQPVFEESFDKVVWEKGERKAAIKLFGELGCTSCHTTGFVDEEAQGPNLYNVTARLRPSWVEKWIANPQAIMPGTTMMNFWEDENPAPEILGGDDKKQIKALTKYVLELGIGKKYPKGYKKYHK